MNEDDVTKIELQRIMELEYLPAIPDGLPDKMTCKKYPLSTMSSLGVAFTPLVTAMQSITTGAGGSGVYLVNTFGKQMFSSTAKTGFIGSLKTDAGGVGGGQAALTQLPCDPTMLFMAAALMTIEKKLDDIQELQRDIMDYLKAKEKAKIRGDINVLTDIMNNYKYNCDNEKYKTNKHILVQDIRKESEQSLLLFRDQIERLLEKRDLLHSDEEVKAKLRQAQLEFSNYQMALYLYSFSSFLEVMLLENFAAEYLESVSKRIEEYTYNYRELYTFCYDHLEGFAQTSVQSFLTKGMSSLSKSAGKAIAKIPVVSKGPVDEALISAGGKLGSMVSKKTKTTMESLSDCAGMYSSPFVENIKAINEIYNTPTTVFFDAANIYFLADIVNG